MGTSRARWIGVCAGCTEDVSMPGEGLSPHTHDEGPQLDARAYAVEPNGDWDWDTRERVETHFAGVEGVVITIRCHEGRERMVHTRNLVGFAQFPYATRVGLLVAHVTRDVAESGHLIVPAHDVTRIAKDRGVRRVVWTP